MELERERAAAREAEVKRLRAVMQSTGVAESMRRQRELQEEMALAYKVRSHKMKIRTLRNVPIGEYVRSCC